MSLWQEVTNARMAIKHTPEAVDLDDMRALLGRVDDALLALHSLTVGADLTFKYNDDSERWHVTLRTTVDDRGPLFAWMAEL